MVPKLPYLPDVSSKYGAPMGRRDSHAEDKTAPIKFYLRRMEFVDGDYDRGGAYWGGGGGDDIGHIYQAYAENDEQQVIVFVRAPDRSTARHYVSLQYPNARYYR